MCGKLVRRVEESVRLLMKDAKTRSGNERNYDDSGRKVKLE